MIATRSKGKRRVRLSRRKRILVGVLVGVLAPLAVGLGAAAAYVGSVDLPADTAQPQATVLYYRDGRTILTRVGTTDHSDVPLARVPVEVWRVVLAAEDREFTAHNGVSMRGVLRALVSNLRGGREGASTITQQYVRNAFLTQDFSFTRKAKEAALAVKIERKYSKEQILERYLNTIYFGRGAYGIAAAANAYFGVPPERLTGAQGAVLAAVVKDPFNFDPAVDPVAARDRWTWIVKAAQEMKWLPAGVAYPKVVNPKAEQDGRSGLVIDQVEHELAKRGISSQDLHTKGLSITTTLDQVAQPAAVKQVAAHLKGQPAGLRAALVALDPKSGAVRAYYGNDKGSGYFDFAASAHPAASTFKPIVLASALMYGWGAESRWNGSSPRVFQGRGPLSNDDNGSCPDCTLKEAMVLSLNTTFYAVTEKVGVDTVRDLAIRLGVSEKYDGQKSLVDAKGDPEPGRTRPDIALGRYPVTPVDMATVYGTLASGGVRHNRYFVEAVADADGGVLYKADPVGKPVLEPSVSDDVSSVLAETVNAHSARLDRPAAGKTGTQQFGDSDDNQDAWMAGYTPDLATVVWLGGEKPGPIRDKAGKPIDGDTVPSGIWRSFVTEALAGTPPTPLPPAANTGGALGDAEAVDQPEQPEQQSTAAPEAAELAGRPQPSVAPTRAEDADAGTDGTERDGDLKAKKRAQQQEYDETARPDDGELQDP